MKMNEMIKVFMNEHQTKINLFQWAITSSVSALLYSEYIKNIKQQQVPSRIIWLPQVKTITEILDTNSYFTNLLSESLIDFMTEDLLFKKYANAPELIIFSEDNDNIEILKTIFDIHIIPNISRSLSSTITKKFGLLNPDNKLIKESRDIDLFDRQNINDDQFRFVVREAILQLLILLPSINKKDEFPTDNSRILLTEDEIITVNHDNAICPIHFDKEVIRNKTVMNLLSFVTNTSISEINWGDKAICKGDEKEIVCFEAISNPFNRTMVTKLLDIK